MPKRRQIVYAFIDSQNLNLGIRSLGWELDFQRFRVYLKHKYRVLRAFLFIGFVPGNEKLYKHLRDCGYEIVFKPTVKDRHGKVKGNIDADLVLHAAKIRFRRYDKAVVVSSDGDFYCLYKELARCHKLDRILIPNKRNESSLLKRFQEYKDFLQYKNQKLSSGVVGAQHVVDVFVSPS